MRKLTMKQKGFIKDTIKFKNPTKAIKLNYDLGSKNGSKTPIQYENTAKGMASENLAKPYIQKVLREKGLKIEDLIDELKENMKLSKDGQYYNTHLEGVKIGLRLYGELNDKREVGGNTYIIGYINSSELKKLQSEPIEAEFEEIPNK